MRIDRFDRRTLFAVGKPFRFSKPIARPNIKAEKKLQIGLFGLFGWGNLGNDGSLEAMLQIIRDRYPDAELTCICPGIDKVEAIHNIKTTPIVHRLPQQLLFMNKLLLSLPSRAYDLLQTFRMARRLDIIIVPGTGILDDFGEHWLGMPYDLFRWAFCARLSGTHFAFVSIGAGPIHGKMNRKLMIGAARLAHYRSYRDTISKDFMLRHGVKAEHDLVTPDLAFALNPPASAPRQDASAIIGVGIMGYYGWRRAQTDGPAIYDRYLTQITEICRWLLDQGYHIRLLMGDDGDRSAIFGGDLCTLHMRQGTQRLVMGAGIIA